jgi:malonate-semialdehyde dehydrogenase (acetylating)/methylmalonate-semialdehyde dehydrogenase
MNNHAYGNGTSIFNVPIPVPMVYHSFGGWKASIFGDHGVYGMEGVRYTKLKTVTARWPTDIRAGAEFAFKARN